ncbi:hypothetical protein VNO77_02783 [Canavalia gladiata]|uniref:Uncharacterized protein n=1 Tax=Canavalia gladiata TaxID=3824 RepID=A0AAN9R3B5_CANGL
MHPPQLHNPKNRLQRFTRHNIRLRISQSLHVYFWLESRIYYTKVNSRVFALPCDGTTTNTYSSCFSTINHRLRNSLRSENSIYPRSLPVCEERYDQCVMKKDHHMLPLILSELLAYLGESCCPLVEGIHKRREGYQFGVLLAGGIQFQWGAVTLLVNFMGLYEK